MCLSSRNNFGSAIAGARTTATVNTRASTLHFLGASGLAWGERSGHVGVGWRASRDPLSYLGGLAFRIPPSGYIVPPDSLLRAPIMPGYPPNPIPMSAAQRAFLRDVRRQVRTYGPAERLAWEGFIAAVLDCRRDRPHGPEPAQRMRVVLAAQAILGLPAPRDGAARILEVSDTLALPGYKVF